MARTKRQFSFYADDDVAALLDAAPAGMKAKIINKLIRDGIAEHAGMRQLLLAIRESEQPVTEPGTVNLSCEQIVEANRRLADAVFEGAKQLGDEFMRRFNKELNGG
jgi:hypothetical protein